MSRCLLLMFTALLFAGCDDRKLEAALARVGHVIGIGGGGRGRVDDILSGAVFPPVAEVAEFGARAVPGLAKLLESGTHAEKWQACIVAGLIGAEASPLVPAILACARDPELERPAFLSLAHIAPTSKRFRGLVAARYLGPSWKPHVIYAAVLVLPAASAAERKRLEEAATDMPDPGEISAAGPDPDRAKIAAANGRMELAEMAAWALGRQGREAAESVPALIRVAPRGGQEYFTALLRIDTAPAREALSHFLRGDDVDSRTGALDALSTIDPVPDEVWKALEQELASEKPVRVLNIISSMGGRARRLMPRVVALIENAESVSPSHRFFAALRALGRMGELSAEAETVVQRALNHEVGWIQNEARKAFRK